MRQKTFKDVLIFSFGRLSMLRHLRTYFASETPSNHSDILIVLGGKQLAYTLLKETSY